MQHQCSVKTKQGSIIDLYIFGNIFQRLRTRFRRIVVISSDNPRSSKYCRSERALREEKQRQLNSKYPWIIHPFSKFRAWYDMYLILFYFCCLLVKPIDAAFARTAVLFPGYRAISTIIDCLSWGDILINFSTGFFSAELRRIELRPGKIAKHYMRSPYFICDAVSSIPRNLPYYITTRPNRPFLGVVNVLTFFKLIRLFTVMGLIDEAAQYFQVRRRGVIFVISSSLVTVIIVHWLACLQFIVPRLIGHYFSSNLDTASWIHAILHDHWTKQYTHCFFKGSAEILGVWLPMYKITLKEDYLVAIFTYVVGRILLAAVWIILTMTFLNGRAMKIKFVEIMNQLEEYMEQKHLPIDLKKRIAQFYIFKFQKRYFKDTMITGMLSSQLRKEVNIHVCRSLISNVPIFSDLTMEETGIVVTKLIPEIFLSKDTVIHSGTASDELYFISSGTVALYTQSGQELCHLQDGGFFGEMCLAVKNYSSQITVVAIEITHIYKLKRNDFHKCFRNRKDIRHNIMGKANATMAMILKIEQEYQNEKLRRALNQTVDDNIESVRRKRSEVVKQHHFQMPTTEEEVSD